MAIAYFSCLMLSGHRRPSRNRPRLLLLFRIPRSAAPRKKSFLSLLLPTQTTGRVLPLVRNSLVSTFFRSRPSSPSSASRVHDNKSSSNSSLFKRWMKGPFHRRSRSAPEDIPPEPNPKPIKGSPTLPDLNFGAELRLTQSPIAAI
ncbi:hypothetical protein IW261DRAFT_1556028 [Armillaria novae-zelandiae]|uniref:Uncharacterized protein n=1 Tax=Armillaria novae-zelandiae TaxID=153914 RepID=A0AA39PUL9_9AGAR|nr:hypothetical protein IW261DRAFT_1556028 [Armillaria novae-zelandiae]